MLSIAIKATAGMAWPKLSTFSLDIMAIILLKFPLLSLWVVET